MTKQWTPVRAFALALVTAFAMLATAAQAQSVSVTVDGTPISAQEVSQRAGLLRLEGQGASNAARNQLARDQLIEEAIKLNEAERLSISVSESQIDGALQTIAENMRVSTSNLNRILTENGVNPDTLRARVRATIAWQQVVQQVVSSRVQLDDLQLDIEASQQLEESESFDYILKEVIFVIPDGSGVSASSRTAQANQYRSRYQGCDAAVDLVLEYNDAAVRDIGRRHATQMPDPIADELAGLSVGQLTRPRVTDNGVSMYAICEKAAARDLTFIKQDLRQEAGTEQLQEEAERYLQTLRDQAVIVRQ